MAGKPAGRTVVVEAAGREIPITSADKVFFPQRGETKLDLVRYYQAVEQPLLRAMGDRPVLMQRFPDGAGGPSFFQKRVPKSAPSWLRTTVVQTVNGTPSNAMVAADLAHVLWAVNIGCLGFHVWPYKVTDEDHVDELRLDLDPQPGTGFDEARVVAHELRALLDEKGLHGYPKTTGNRGLHVYVRLQPHWDAYQVRAAAVALARELERRRPDIATAAWWKEERGQRIFVDYNQNAPHKTVFGAWSARSRVGAQVSTPLSWRARRRRQRRPHLGHRRQPGRGPRRPVGHHRRRTPVARTLAGDVRARPRQRPPRRTLAPRLPQDAERTSPRRPLPRPHRRLTPTARSGAAGQAGGLAVSEGVGTEGFLSSLPQRMKRAARTGQRRGRLPIFMMAPAACWSSRASKPPIRGASS